MERANRRASSCDPLREAAVVVSVVLDLLWPRGAREGPQAAIDRASSSDAVARPRSLSLHRHQRLSIDPRMITEHEASSAPTRRATFVRTANARANTAGSIGRICAVSELAAKRLGRQVGVRWRRPRCERRILESAN
jgi:hypothetical protein